MKFRTSRRSPPKLIDALFVALALLCPALTDAASFDARTGPLGPAAHSIGAGHAATSRHIPFSTSFSNAREAEIVKAPPPQKRFASQRFSALIDEAARNTALDPALVHAVITVESRYNPAARSVKGAIGLMQVLPETAARYGVADPGISPAENLRAGTRYLSYLMTLFDNQIELALAAYNAGEYAVLRHGHRIPPYRETQNYVPAVLAIYHRLREREPPPEPATIGIHYMSGTTLEPGVVDKLIYRLGDPLRSGRN